MSNKRIVNSIKIFFAVLAAVILVGALVFMPFIIDIIYDCTPPNQFFDVDLSRSDILDYYTQLLSLISTIVLGVIAVVQTYRSQKKSDEINDLQLSIAQRELTVVEKQYESEMDAVKAIAPRFEIKIVGYSGCYSKINVEIKNVSEMLISAFRIISFDVYKREGEVYSIKRWKLKFQSMASAEVQNVEFFTPDMCDNGEKNGQIGHWENVKLVWKFSCDDCKGNKHFYSASLNIPNTNVFTGEYWEILKIG